MKILLYLKHLPIINSLQNLHYLLVKVDSIKKNTILQQKKRKETRKD